MIGLGDKFRITSLVKTKVLASAAKPTDLKRKDTDQVLDHSAADVWKTCLFPLVLRITMPAPRSSIARTRSYSPFGAEGSGDQSVLLKSVSALLAV